MTRRAGRRLEYAAKRQRFLYIVVVDECPDCYRKKVRAVALCDQQVSLTDCRKALHIGQHVCIDYGLLLDRHHNTTVYIPYKAVLGAEAHQVASCEGHAPGNFGPN
ncbi:MAG: hypothetical protein OXC54_03265 [Rhodospirillaceae bacterium]|nr:hypothetical protein [Rhodospirillaceae bacterium]